jgi:hypothetical protein
LERISTQLARIERDQRVMMESQALCYQLTINAPLPEPDQRRAPSGGTVPVLHRPSGRNIAAGNRTLGRAGAMNGQG